MVWSDWFAVKMPTASVYCGIAPMKNADWALFVVPVLAMIGRPSGSCRLGPGAVVHVVQQRPVHRAGLVLGEHPVLVTAALCSVPFSVKLATRCGVITLPPLANVE